MPTLQTPPRTRSARKVRIGVVTSNKMQKTIVVRVSRLIRHAKYNRVITCASSFKAHDERQEAGIGDLVRIMETRPLSKDKRWRLVGVVRRASSAPPVPGEDTEQPSKSTRREPQTPQVGG